MPVKVGVDGRNGLKKGKTKEGIKIFKFENYDLFLI